MKLLLPVRDIHITQEFGVSFTWFDKEKGKFVDFYKNLGLNGHMGIDFRAKMGCKVTAAHEGKINKAYFNKGAGNYIEILGTGEADGYATGYAHLEEMHVKEGDRVKAGQVIGTADNTGVYTTGDHLHFELKPVDSLGRATLKNNGYNGCINPAPFFVEQYGKDWFQPAAYHRYGRKADYWKEFNMRFKNYWLHRQLKKINKLGNIYDNIFINKLVYGFWSFDEAINPAMNFITDHLTKDELKRGLKPFE